MNAPDVRHVRERIAAEALSLWAVALPCHLRPRWSQVGPADVDVLEVRDVFGHFAGHPIHGCSCRVLTWKNTAPVYTNCAQKPRTN